MVEKHSELSGNTYASSIPTLNPEEPIKTASPLTRNSQVRKLTVAEYALYHFRVEM